MPCVPPNVQKWPMLPSSLSFPTNRPAGSSLTAEGIVAGWPREPSGVKSFCFNPGTLLNSFLKEVFLECSPTHLSSGPDIWLPSTLVTFFILWELSPVSAENAEALLVPLICLLPAEWRQSGGLSWSRPGWLSQSVIGPFCWKEWLDRGPAAHAAASSPFLHSAALGEDSWSWERIYVTSVPLVRSYGHCRPPLLYTFKVRIRRRTCPQAARHTGLQPAGTHLD